MGDILQVTINNIEEERNRVGLSLNKIESTNNNTMHNVNMNNVQHTTKRKNEDECTEPSKKIKKDDKESTSNKHNKTHGDKGKERK